MKKPRKPTSDKKAEKAAAEAAPPTGATATAELSSLSQLLDEIARFSEKEAATATAATAATSASVPGASTDAATGSASGEPAASTAVVPAAAPVTAQAMLVQAADFDRRLALLERSIGIGIGSAALPGMDGGALPRAIMPTLETLQRQVTTLADASTASLDGISRRVRALTQEVDELAQSRKAAKAAHEALVQAGVQTSPQSSSGAGVVTPVAAGTAAAGSATTAAGAGGDPDDQVAKINALYGMLPTIESMTPLLPPLLDRLRSLQTIHADAALASELLDDLEQRQVDTAAEVGQWREGLEKIEAAMRESEATMGKNMQVMDGWVKELEGRLDKVV